MKYMQFDLESVFNLITYCSGKTNLTESIIEKDLWNCYFLDYLFNKSKFKGMFIFKGGTSLSKCYNLIDRYSEDLDVVLDARILNIDLDEKLASLTSTTQKNKFVDYIDNLAMNYIENEIMPVMQKECEKEINKKLKFSIDREELAFYIEYPFLASYDDYVLPRIKIEMSSLSATIPTETKQVKAYLDEVVSDEYKYSFNVKCMKPERTFWEKAVILHQEANRENGNIPNRYSRHYYDLYKIYNSSLWDETINNIDLLEQVRKFTMTFYNRAWAKFENAKPGTFKLVPNQKYYNIIKEDYERMKSMIFSDIPSFETIIDTMSKIEKEINK